MIKWNSFVPLLIKNVVYTLAFLLACFGLAEWSTEVSLVDLLEWETLNDSSKLLILGLCTTVPLMLTLWEVRYDEPENPQD